MKAKPAPKPFKKAPPYVCTKPIVFTVIKGSESREVTIDPKYADAEMPIFGFAFALMAGGGGKITIISGRI